MSKKLIVSDGNRDRELQLVGRIVIGRDPSCDVSHDDSLLSRRHAEFLTAGDDVTVKDLGSRNGVFVNGARAAEQRLAAGDLVQIGPLRARYVVDQAPASITPEEMEVERTAIFASPVIPPATPDTSDSVGTPAVIAAVPAFNSGSVEEFDPEEEVTRLVPAPRMPKPGAPTEGLGSADAASSAPAAPPLPAAPNAPQDLSGFVFGNVVALAVIIVAASVLPAMLSAGSFAALAVPIGVALVASYVIGCSINRRVTRALESVERAGT